MIEGVGEMPEVRDGDVRQKTSTLCQIFPNIWIGKGLSERVEILGRGFAMLLCTVRHDMAGANDLTSSHLRRQSSTSHFSISMFR